MAVDRVRRGGTDDQKRNPTHSRLKRGVGVGGTRQGGVAGINKVSCKFHVTLFSCRVGGDVGQLGVARLLRVYTLGGPGAWPSHTALSLASNAPTSPVQKRNSQHSAGKTVSFFYWLAIDTPMSLPMYSEQIHTRKRRIVTLRLLYRPAPIIASLC